MNILFVMNHYPDSRNGGIENVTKMLAEYLSAQNCSISVLFLNSSKYDHMHDHLFVVSKSVDARDLGKAVSEIVKSYNIDIIINRCVIWATPKIREAIGNTACKIITTYNNKPTLTPPSLRDFLSNRNVIVKTVLFLSYPLFCIRSRLRLRRRHQKCYFHTDSLILLSKYYVDEYVGMMRLPDSHKISVINNPINYASESDATLTEKGKELLIVTRFDERQKNILQALRIWAKVEHRFPDWKLKLIGDGPDKALVAETIAEMQLHNVVMLAACPPITHYQSASVFLMTSKNEGWPNTINEAMHFGCVPIVMNTFSAVNEMIVSGFDGFIIDHEKEEDFVSALVKLMENPQLLIQMSKNAIESTTRLNIRIIGQQWLSLFKKLADNDSL